MTTRTATDDNLANVERAIDYANELFTRLDNGEQLRPWEIVEGRNATLCAGYDLGACDAPECTEPHCFFEDERKRYPEYGTKTCDVIIEDLREQVESLTTELRCAESTCTELREQWGQQVDEIARLQTAASPDATYLANLQADYAKEHAELMAVKKNVRVSKCVIDHQQLIPVADLYQAQQRIGEVITENKALREMIALLKERSDFLVKAMHTRR